ncbi:hypothetical protein jhhlp_008688 [Lomentospora prolificans]|uniref:Uncharacterized protein n=1 Tax=Lomentospora prolificans TaxID=41688 RepID=A0A2N3MYT2_9PEZI|nr:hypothetical protein jhhlp_008688 [Lomentospora prolificans]
MTPLDNAMKSKVRASLFLPGNPGSEPFGGVITAVAAWSIWGGDMFPAQADPTGNPDGWSTEEMRRWLKNRNLMPAASATREELLERIKANMRHPAK